MSGDWRFRDAPRLTPAEQAILEPFLLGTGYTLIDLRGYAKYDRRLVELRRRVAQALRDEGLSTPRIGRLLNRDHTSILSAIGHRPSPAARP